MRQPNGKPINTSKLLIEEEPLQVLPALAVALGLNEAIALQQLHYWLRKKPHYRDGRDWHYNRYVDWQKQFPFWSISTIKRTMVSLEKSGVVVTANYNNSPIDKTKWYTIDYNKLNGLHIDSTAQNEPSTNHSEPSTAQNEPSRDQDEPSMAQDDPTMAQNEPLHGSNWSHQSPENNTETTDREKPKDSLTTFESSSGEANDPASPDHAGGSEQQEPAKGSIPKKAQKAKAITPIPDDHWLRGLLEEYTDEFDLALLDDWHWWSTFAKTFPANGFTKNFVATAFADLALWLSTNPERRPMTRKGWFKRMKYSLTQHYTETHSRRVSSKGVSTGAVPLTKGEQRQADIMSNMDSLPERIKAYEARGGRSVYSGTQEPATLLPGQANGGA